MARRIRKAILGRKVGMSQVYSDDGVWIPVTLIEAGPCTVIQVKEEQRDGYSALQVGYQDTKKGVKKPQQVAYDKVGVAPKKYVREIPLTPDKEWKVGDLVDLSVMEGVEQVDVSGTSKGRGFAGVVKRWNHQIGPKSHGSKAKRIPGSIGQHQDPGRVIKGKNMPGHLGAEKVKTRNLKVVSLDSEQNLMVVRGAVPGPKGGFLYIEESL